MNKIINKQTKKIIIMILIVLVFNFVVPNYTFAINGGIFFKPIAQFIVHLADLILSGLHLFFVGSGDMIVNETYAIRYSPGIIFSGIIPAFEVDFINPNLTYEIKSLKAIPLDSNAKPEDLKFTLEDLQIEDRPLELYKENGIVYNFMKTGNLKDGEGRNKLTTEPYCADSGALSTAFGQGPETSVGVRVGDILDVINIEFLNSDSSATLDNNIFFSNEYTSSWEDGPVKYNEQEYSWVSLKMSKYHWIMPTENYGNMDINVDIYYYDFYNESRTLVLSETYGLLSIKNVTQIKYILSTDGQFIESTAKQLRGFVATWFKVLKEFSLVGLFLVLVYSAIRMILSSTTKDKAKYKKMLINWFTAIIIIFILPYIITLVTEVTETITSFFAKEVTGTLGEDELMSTIRYEIGEDPSNFMKIFAEVVMYVVLVVYTLMFSLQYLKRTIYIAFLIMISPLVAFTYPIDKMKDGKAQAFSTWLRELIYSLLVQPVHLILYVMLVSTAMDLVQKIPIYAIIVIGFLLPAEKFVKSMFGLDRANTVGNMTSALGGAAVMNAINKIGSIKPKGNSSGGGSSSSDNGSKVRMANEGAGDAYDALRGGSSAQKGEAQSKASMQKANTQNGNTAETDSQSANTARTAEQKEDIEDKNEQEQQQNVKTTDEEKTETNTKNTSQNSAPKREIKNAPSRWEGIKGVGKKYVFNKNTGKKLLKGSVKGAAKVAGVAALGTIGLAAGIATGDMEKAISGAGIGLAAGSKLGGNLVDGGENLIKGAAGGAKEIKDTYREGKYGEAARMKFDEEFKKSKEYKNLIKNHPGQEETVQDFLNAGITDTKQMGKAMKGMKDGKYNSKEAIAYMKMANAKDCPDEILYDDEKFKNYLSSHGIDEAKAKEIRKGIIDFK